MEDWVLPSPSPRTLMSSFFNEEFSSAPFSNIFGDDRSNKPQDEVEKSKACIGSSAQETSQDKIESNLFGSNQKSTSPGGLAERMAARAGFGVLKIDTSRISSSGATIRSPLTIPPGVSPRELLESAVFLPNAISQPSPTTGKLPFLVPSNFKSTMPSVPEKSEDHLHKDCAFSFQHILRSKPSTLWTAEKCQGSSVVHQTQSLMKDSQELNLRADPTATKHETDENLVKPMTCDSMFDNDHPSPDVEPEQSEEVQNGEDSSAPVTSPADDGYNWRKYGRKQVKNNYLRSYYKCAHPNCPVKKLVERSLEGHITKIVYRGSHSHPLPLPNRRSSVPLSQFNDSEADGLENFSSKPGPDYNSATSQGIALNGQFQDVHSRALETKLSGSVTTTEIADTSVMDSMDVSSTLYSNEKGNRAMHCSFPSNNGMNEDENESKRRKMEVSVATNTSNTGIDMAVLASRASREPRIVVQTTSEVDILDDGYRWRKYGQKVVKGNPNPRSYYKCTYAGCSVRKHVERAWNDLKSVITTYEGKHNHEVPSVRNSNGQPTSGSGAALQGSGLQRRPEPPQFSMPHWSTAAAAYGSLCLPPQLSAGSGGFSFEILPPGMAMPVPSLGNFMPTQMRGHGSPVQGCTGLMLPRGEEKVNPEQQSRLRLPVVNANAVATYQQFMGRWPQGHQM